MDRTTYQFDRIEALRAAPLRRVGGGSGERAPPPNAPNPRIGVIYNPRSHRNRGQDLECTQRLGITVAQPESREQIAEALADLDRQGVDFLIINGGDGTVRDVLTMGQGVFGDNWPALAVLPKGKTNALTVDLGVPTDWSLSDAVAAWSDGRRVRRRPLAITAQGRDEPAVMGFFLGAGAFTIGTRAGQDAHALGFFGSLAVGATAAWGVLQALLGSNRNQWRRGSEMAISRLSDGSALAHSQHGDPGRRSIILASTLRHMPMGLKLFAPDSSGIKLVAMDKPLRRLLLSFPAILYGWRPAWLERAGFHQTDGEGFAMRFAEPFILDGEAFDPGQYRVEQGPDLTFVTA
ncbi:diacylglycerol/lipid kinase family protein [Qipengyuania marisflavi]|uniref:DAGKc domain-containing protein n=1 Tax=Qipengyuania marisflavi TaxID=2486356 RepID=A0A5S3PXG9_9SPHN|nr:acylglycerol kinase family protein [Qipengyuania marisflavi]TMM48285.1 hypothetical protein FEV51_08365 [Qipengyuania marisflavi]